MLVIADCIIYGRRDSSISLLVMIVDEMLEMVQEIDLPESK